MLKRIVRIKPIQVITINHRLLVENKLYKRSDNRVFNNTNSKYKHMNQYSTDAFKNYKIKRRNVKNAYYMFTNDVVINKHNTIDSNDAYNVTKMNKLVNFNDNTYSTKKIEHTNNITNNTTRHNHNNYINI